VGDEGFVEQSNLHAEAFVFHDSFRVESRATCVT
jgi:hypothetical protein